MLLQQIIDNGKIFKDQRAIIHSTSKVSYGMLRDKALNVASSLKKWGLQKGDSVIVNTNRDIDLVPTILGVLLAGGVYVPVESKMPKIRICEIIKCTKPFTVIDDKTQFEESDQVTNFKYHPSDLAYIFFTSGSTGKPKGVSLSYHNLESFLNWALHEYSPSELKKTLFSTSISFDLSIFEIFVPLIAGQTILQIEKIGDILENDIEPTLINTVPSAVKMLLDSNRLPESTKVLNIAGEALPQKYVNQIYDVKNDIKVYNLYGPTECTTYCTTYLAQRNEPCEYVPIGRALPNAKITIIDKDLNELPIGSKGEILISGECVGAGYFGDIELTNEKFIFHHNHLLNSYRSGDIGSIDTEGRLIYHGRKDQQVKIRGYRVELQEIEKRLLSIFGVDNAVVFYENELLVAFVKSTNSAEMIQKELSLSLPDYMIPRVEILKTVPLNSNGKIDRSLLKKYLFESDEEIKKREPKSDELISLLKRNLKTSEIDLSKNFLQHGGNSLMATHILYEVKNHFKRNITIKEIYESATLADLITKINPENNKMPLYSWEEKYIAFEKIHPGKAVYHVTVGFKLSKSYKLDTVQKAVHQLQELYPYLTSRYHEETTGFFRVNGTPTELFVSPTADNQEIYRFTYEPFNLFNDHLIRIGLFGDHTLILCCHHSLVDGISFKAVLTAFFKLLENEKTPSQLMMEWKSNAEHLNFWINEIKQEAPLLRLPSYQSRRDIFDYRGKTITRTISKKYLKQLDSLLHAYHVPLSTLIFSLYAIVLGKFCRQQEITIGVPFANRMSGEEELSLGCYVNTLPIRLILSLSETFTSLLIQTRDQIWRALSHQRALLEDIIKEKQIQTNLTHHSLFQALFVVLPEYQELEKKYEIKEIPLPSPHAKFDCTLQFRDLGDTLSIGFEYATSLLSDEQAELFMEMLNLNLNNLVEEGDFNLNCVIYPKSKHNKQLVKFPKQSTVIDQFVMTTINYPDQIAVEDERSQMSYETLNFKSSCLADLILKKTTSPYVGILLTPGTQLIVSILAVLKAGKAYVPLDPMLPEKRMEYIIKDAGIDCLITENSVKEDFKCEVINPWKIHPFPLTKYRIEPNAIAYVIYTSGTSGKPKGVKVSHHNIVRLLRSIESSIHLTSNDTTCLFHSYGFDVSVWEIFSMLFYGGTLHIPPFELTRSPQGFFAYLKERKITILNQTPTALKSLLKTWKEPLPFLQKLIVAGESLEPTVVDLWKNSPNFPLTSLINMYGITETTVHTTYYLVRGDETKSIIGKPLCDMEIVLVDEHLNRVPEGLCGEILVRGDGISYGYLNQESLTRERFISHPEFEGEILYRSGDLAQYDMYGNLIYLGRIDRQIQLRGYRIEVSEIESLVFELHRIQSYIVLEVVEDDEYLCLYLECHEFPSNLKIQLKSLLPSYMVPSYYYAISEIPRTVNGKIDIDKLKELKQFVKVLEDPIDSNSTIETAIKNVFEEILHVKISKFDDNFFEHGAHSLSLVKAASKLVSLGYPVDVIDMFQHSTIKSLAEFIQTKHQVEVNACET